MRCAFCARPAGLVLLLDPARTSFRAHGKEQILAPQVEVCAECGQLYRDGRDDVLASRQSRIQRTDATEIEATDIDATDVEEITRTTLAALRSAHIGTVAADDLLPPGAAELRREGFTPVEYLTRMARIGGVWPPDHRRELTETRPDRDPICWFVRSPWPWASTEEVVAAMLTWAEDGADVARGHRRAHGPPGRRVLRPPRGNDSAHASAIGSFSLTFRPVSTATLADTTSAIPTNWMGVSR